MTGTQNNTAQIDETAVNSFNQKFELYESTNTKGATVKGLLTTIQNNPITHKEFSSHSLVSNKQLLTTIHTFCELFQHPIPHIPPS